MAITKDTFKHVDYLWDEEKAKSLGDDQVALLLYRSNILGADLRITNYGGGNTSCKTIEKDPLTKKDTEVMWIKGSGGDIGTLKRNGLAGLYMDKLLSLKNVYRGLEFEDEMVALFNHCIYDLDSKAPSIDTPLHAFLPFKHIDHLHPDAAIAIAASKDGEKITEELFEGQIAWVPWQRPGFDLALKLDEALKANPGIRGIMLGGHGLFTWAETSYECYINSLEVIDKASQYLEENYGKNRPVFGGQKVQSIPEADRKLQAAKLAPHLRGLASSFNRMVGHFSDDERVLEFINSNDLAKLAPLGTSCPDHFLRTKIRPLVLDIPADKDLTDMSDVTAYLEKEFEDYRQYYTKYYEDHKRDNSPGIRDSNPVVILWPGVGMFSYAKNKQTARVASEFYTNAINVMKGAEAISEYVSLPLQEAFDIEYWLLEEAKLQRMPKEQPLSRKVAFVTGGAGGIGKAIADKLAKEGACVFITDINQGNLEEALNSYNRDTGSGSLMDVTKMEDIEAALHAACLKFGGVDIIVNCAGLAISKPIDQTTEKDWDILQNVLVKGQFAVSKAAVAILRAQNKGGDIINIASKNALVSGPNNVGYGTAKAAQVHMSRLLAAELGPDKIRVNVVNPDAVIEGSKIWEGEWAKGRAKAYGITVEELPAFYAKRTIMNEIIGVDDIANGVFAFVGGHLGKSTGNILNVDGGVAAAFVR
ncbi:rhamnulose-1-phosphate aldolase/alcohol dehydrogenase [Cyclobacterium xiamenense]|uniref:Rhamnulose-1-phosphate aldolase/alcohol dehydrogenase n=1 Tax=Cyclobacterium xiamenense TaxID=1297121 RepID=A0A1H6W483_9BACT|nr:bifunctional aldolase/short-chain dehydrogenase [Cyclobacterium xiamenense]SEJ07332.1 rhamnulose-1-phosphate aldolase/alcohol dehydrogenase [Cyclobacterium xiamenense]